MLVPAAFARAHVRSDRPGASCKAEHRLVGIEGGANLAHGLVDRSQPLGHGGKAAEGAVDQARRELGAFAGEELKVLAHRVGHDEDVGEQDRTVESETADRLERDLGRSVGVIDEREESALVGAQGAVLGKVATRLAHEPDRALARVRFAQGVEKKARHRDSGPVQKNKILKRMIESVGPVDIGDG